MKNFNINEYVGVKLTDEALKILEMQHNEQLKSIPPQAAKMIGAFQPPKIDEEGYSQISLCDLMYFFGPYMYNGNIDMLFDTDIRISDEYLIEQSNSKSK